ncbi:3-phosphoshikimate 1-carboxyvinyltransferase [Phyllobacterium phragmitis]|nr:3-phosphoshikimate 1-carboxyvinyltransferase [Phyllobacterium phragmitis]
MKLLEVDKLQVFPAEWFEGAITPPASKSSSTRSVLAATLSKGTSRITNIANSKNVKAMIDCCEALGANICYQDATTLAVDGPGWDGLNDHIVLNPGNSGVVLRLLLGVTACLSDVTFRTDYDRSLGQRSNIEMMDALEALGVQCKWRDNDGKLPIHLDGTNLHGGDTAISCRKSSQFLSGLLFLGASIKDRLSITVLDELKAPDMVRTTMRILKQAGVEVQAQPNMMAYHLPADTTLQPSNYVVGSDPASTAALLAAASVVPSNVRLTSYHEEEMGNGAVLDYLRKLGVRMERSSKELRVFGGGPFVAHNFDGSLAPDAVLPLAAVAAFADGTSRFGNIEHIRYKECDRISDYRAELLKAGIQTEETRDELIIHGSPGGIDGGAEVFGHFDHGVIMALSAIAFGSRHGLIINDPQHVAQTYPTFFDDMQKIGASVTPLLKVA